MKQPRQFLAIARVCEALAKTAATQEEGTSFLKLAKKWRKFASGAGKTRSKPGESSKSKPTQTGRNRKTPESS
jgi:hypothetical protein